MATSNKSVRTDRRQVLTGATALAVLAAVPSTVIAADPDAKLRRLHAEWMRLTAAHDAADDRYSALHIEMDRAVAIPRALSYRANFGRALEINGFPDRAIRPIEIENLFIDHPGKRRYRERLWLRYCEQRAEVARRIGLNDARKTADDLLLRLHDAMEAFCREPARSWAGLAFKLEATGKALFPSGQADIGADLTDLALFHAWQDAQRLARPA